MSLFIISSSSLYASDETKPFSDPEKQFEMPEEWKKKPIVYESWAEGADIAITLNQQIAQALTPIIEKYARDNKLVIKLEKDNCGISSSRNKNKNVDISSLCCPPGYIDRLPGVKFYTLGISPIRILVNRGNPINNVTLDEVRKLFAGEITNWSEIKLPGSNILDKSVTPLGRLHCKPRPGHWKLILHDDELFSPELTEVSSIVEMLHAVSNNNGAIGYEIDWMVRQNEFEDKVKSLKINGYDPEDPSNTILNKYPFYRTFVLTVWESKETKNPLVEKFVKHLVQNIKTLDSKYGLIDASVLKENGWKFSNGELIGEPDEK